MGRAREAFKDHLYKESAQSLLLSVARRPDEAPWVAGFGTSVRHLAYQQHGQSGRLPWVAPPLAITGSI